MSRCLARKKIYRTTSGSPAVQALPERAPTEKVVDDQPHTRLGQTFGALLAGKLASNHYGGDIILM